MLLSINEAEEKANKIMQTMHRAVRRKDGTVSLSNGTDRITIPFGMFYKLTNPQLCQQHTSTSKVH